MNIKKAFNWYVKGYYHCDKCPYCWVHQGYEDCDAGCYIFGELRDTCRLIPPIRALIGWPKRKKAMYWYTHEYDGFGEWYEREEKKREKFNECVLDFLSLYEICWKDENGVFHPINKQEYVNYNAWEIRRDYEDYCNPIVFKPLRIEWKELIAKTFRRFIDVFRPYFGK